MGDLGNPYNNTAEEETFALRITDTDTGYWIDATEQDAPALHEAWNRWKTETRGSNAEGHRWAELLMAADEYFDDCGCDGNNAGEVKEVFITV